MTIELVRPMLAAPTKASDHAALTWPMLASAKIDGIRALCVRNKETGKPELVSRTLKPIPNLDTQARFAHEEYIGLDGELVVGEPTDKNLMQQTTSGVMSVDGSPNAKWYVFDKWDMDDKYAYRARIAKEIIDTAFPPGFGTEATQPLIWVSHYPINSLVEMNELEAKFVEKGFEGMMLRHPYGEYKQGRSTLRQQWLVKIKRFEDAECVILGYVEQMTNNNEATTDERGYTKRSTHQAGKEGAGILGALQVRDIITGVEFDVGTGFTREQRINLWEGRQYLIGKVITYKHFAIGVKDKPRFPTFKSFRATGDM